MWNNIREVFKSMFHAIRGPGTLVETHKPAATTAVQKIAPANKAHNKIRANAAKNKILRSRKRVNDSN